MKKANKLRQIKKYKNLSKYDIGKIPTNSGYQPGTRIDTSGFTSQRGEDIQPEIDEINANILPNTISQTAIYGKNIYDVLNNYKPALTGVTSAATANTASNLISTNTAGIYGARLASPTLSMPETLSMSGGNITASGSVPITRTAGTTASTGGTTGTTALNAAGKAVAIAGALYGTYNLYKGFSDYGNYRHAGDMLNAMSKNTQSVEGVDVTTYGGLNSSAERSYVNAQNKAGLLNNTLSGLGAGASTGSLFGPVGTIVGGAIGGLIGGIGSIFGGSSRKKKVEQAIKNAQTTASNYNKQAVSEAASQGLRNQFNLMHADCGKDRGMRKFNNGKTQDYTKVWTPSGEQYGPANSLVGKGESIIDYDNGKASYVDKGKKRVDNQPSIAAPGDNIVIAGNDIDITNGMSFANQAAPFSKTLQKLDEKEALIKSGKGSSNTKELNMRQLNIAKNKLLSELKSITDRQQMQHKLLSQNSNAPQYDAGKIDFLSAAPYIAGIMAPISQYNYYKNMTPMAQNSYVANPVSRQALQTLGSMRYDPYNQVQAVRDTYRQGVYNINQAGALTSGQRLAALSAQNTGYAKNLADIYGKADEINNDYKKLYAQALLESGEHAATRQQQALATQQENYRQAVAKKRLGIETAQKGMLQIGNTLAKNLFDQKNFNESQAYNNKIIDLYSSNNALDAIRLQNDIQSKQDEINAIRKAKKLPKTYVQKYTPIINANLNNMHNPSLWDFVTLQAPSLYKYIK